MSDSDTSEVVRFRLDGKVYTTADLDEITLKQIVLLERQAAELGVPIRWSAIEQANIEMAAMGEGRGDHPEAALLFAVTLWASRVLAGEDITFGDAIDVPIKAVVFEAEPASAPAAGAAARPTKGSRKGSRQGSGQAAAPAPAE